MLLRSKTPSTTNTQPVQTNEPFVFSTEPIIVTHLYDVPSDVDSGDETDEYDHEERIQSSWHHRALLGDENRVLYTDNQDTDFDALLEKEEEELANETDDELMIF